MVDEAVKISSHKPSAVVVFQRQQCEASLQATSAPKDYDWTELVNKVTREGKNKVECEEMKSTDELYLLYTSGTTGKPKGRPSRPIPIDIRNRSRIRRKCSPTCIHNGIPLQRQTPRNHILCQRYRVGLSRALNLINISGGRTHIHRLRTITKRLNNNPLRR